MFNYEVFHAGIAKQEESTSKMTNAYGSARAGQGPGSRIYQQRRAKLQARGAQRLLRQADKAKPPQRTLFEEQ